MPEPQLRVYPRYTVVAEKLEALTSLGMLNSRMKDFFDLWVLAKHSDFDGSVLLRAVSAAFERRRTAVPQGLPVGLSDEFINDIQKGTQWQAFLRKNALNPMSLTDVIADLREFLSPVLAAISTRHMTISTRTGGLGRDGKSSAGSSVACLGIELQTT